MFYQIIPSSAAAAKKLLWTMVREVKEKRKENIGVRQNRE